MTGMAIVFTFPQEFTYVELGMLQLSDLIKCALILEEYVQTTYEISCEICRETRNDLRSLPMLLAVSSTCPMETLKHIAREMSTMLTYLNVTISGRLITLPVFANVAMYEPQGKPIVKGCDKVYFVAGLAIPIHECPSVQLSFTDMKNAGISNAKMNQLTFSGCIGLKSNDPNMLNISHFRNIHDNCPPSDLQSNVSRVYTVCIDSYFRLRNSSSSSKWVDLIYFSIIVFEVMFYICIFV
ncbi:hypothetical protein DPMN_068704 [Dreissena polymorpha]|uniref:Uncharacterized protein n=1 Tax=Dreissena polymorpha TaxID=45954 RepID=A0A9D3Z2Q1_DREPO|nr:hypothetical protein DPMN_068704 [Dreissena polymorpha]